MDEHQETMAETVENNASQAEANVGDGNDQVDSSTASPEVVGMGELENEAGAPTWAEAEIDEDISEGDSLDSSSPSAEDVHHSEALTREISALKAQLDDRNAQYVRIAADFDNYRKRTQKERDGLEQQIKCSTLSELLPVVDNFERARSQIKPQTDAEMAIHKSYQSVYKQLVDCLKRVGVSPMRSEGSEFDPALHEAVMREPTDEYPEGTVIEELVRGYVLGDRVLRHAMVKVAAAPEPVITSSENSQEGESE